MADPLRIFISHKMPIDTHKAERISSRLSLYGRERVKCTHAGVFPVGIDWREKVDRELENTDWLILLYTSKNQDWSFCMNECGYFQSQMRSHPNKRLITFCHNPEEVNAAVK